MAAIDIGEAAVDLSDTWPAYTTVAKGNPANETGTITSIEIWSFNNLSNCEVATFSASGNSLTTRDTVTIGSVTGGSKQTFTEDSNSDPISLDVQAGDYIGVYYTNGNIEIAYAGGAGVWYKNGDYIPATSVTFTFLANAKISLYGTGETEAAEEDNSIFFGTNF